MTTFNPRRRWTAWLRWPDAEAGPYHVGLTWSGEEAGRVQLVGVEVWTRPPASERVSPGPEGDLQDAVAPAVELTSRLLHGFPLAQVARSARQALLRAFLDETGTRRGRRREAALRASQGLADGRRRLDRTFFVEVTDVYREAVAQGLSPYEAIRARWPSSKSTAIHWVHRARHEYGLLPQTERGRVSA